MPNVALATCLNLPEPDVDEDLVLNACRAAGIGAKCVAWDDPSAQWQNYDLVVVRSTWDYYQHAPAFRQWIADVAIQTQLLNPATTMLANIHKSYLAKLAAKRIPIVATVFVGPGSKLPHLEWDRFVIKPAISAGSFMTRAFERNQTREAEAFLDEVLTLGDAMIQEFMESVASGGEVALIHIDGELTHGVIKHPRFADGEESVSLAESISEEQRDLTDQVMATVSKDCLYARVDVMLDNDGKWVLSELELIEPSLFFRECPDSLDRFIDSLQARLGLASA